MPFTHRPSPIRLSNRSSWLDLYVTCYGEISPWSIVISAHWKNDGRQKKRWMKSRHFPLKIFLTKWTMSCPYSRSMWVFNFEMRILPEAVSTDKTCSNFKRRNFNYYIIFLKSINYLSSEFYFQPFHPLTPRQVWMEVTFSKDCYTPGSSSIEIQNQAWSW